MAYAIRYESSSSSDDDDDRLREPEPEPEPEQLELPRRQLPGHRLKFQVPPDPDARFEDPTIAWPTWTEHAPGLLEPARPSKRRLPATAARGAAALPDGWEQRTLDNRDGGLNADWLGGVLASSAKGPWVYVHNAAGDVRFSLPAADEHGRCN